MASRRLAYQREAFPLAGTGAEDRRTELKALLMEAAAKLAPFARTKRARQACWDVARGRHEFAVLKTLLDVQDASDIPTLIPDALAAYGLARRPAPPCPTEALLAETDSNGPANKAAELYLIERTPIRAKQAADAHAVQEERSRQAKLALLAAAHSHARAS